MLETQKHWCQILLARITPKSSTPKYQLLLFLNCGLKWLLAGMILFSLNFFYITPEFQCEDGEAPVGKTCQDYVCGLGEDQWLQHFPTPLPRSIALDFGVLMVCSNKWLSSLLQSLSYIGAFVGYLLMSHLADNSSRKKTQSVSWALSILGVGTLILSVNLYMVGLGSFLMGLGTNAAITLHYTILKELLVGEMRQRSFLILQVMFSIGVGLVALGAWVLEDWRIVAAAILGPAVLVLAYGLWIIEETPHFSLRKGKHVLLKSLNRIARVNCQQQLDQQELEFVPEGTGSRRGRAKYSMVDLFSYGSLVRITLTCSALNLSIQFIYDGTILSLDKIGINVYLNQILVGFVEIFAALFCSWIVVKVRRNAFMKLCFGLVAAFCLGVGAIVLAFQHKDNQLSLHVIIQMILLACLRFVLNCAWGVFFVYAAELYPTNILSLAFGWISTAGSIGAFTAPFIRLLTADATMFFMAGLCVMSFFLVGGLRETKGEKPVHEIFERQTQENGRKSLQTDTDTG